MKNRERVLATLHFERPDDRLPMIEWASWWDRTLDAWHSQGLSAEIPWDGLAPALGLDRHVQFWLPHRTADCPQPAFNGARSWRTSRITKISCPASIRRTA